MPLKRRRLRRSDRFDWENLSGNDRFCLAFGFRHHRPESTVFRTEEDLREAWEANRDRLCTVRGLDDDFGGDCHPTEPGKRPRYYWKFEASELPRQIGWRKLRCKPCHYWYLKRGYKVGDKIGRRKVFELQEDVLRRLGEIGPDEERLLDANKRKEAQHVRAEKPDCRCQIHARHRTYPHRLAPFFPAVQVGLPTDSEQETET